MVGRGHAAIDRLLQQDFLDIIRREAAFGERRAHMKAEFIPLAERDHGADHKHAPGTLVEMRPGPDLAPRMARDQIEELGVERIPVGDRFIHPGIAEHLAALHHAVVSALLIVHVASDQRCVRKPTTASVKAWGCSTLEICAASRIVKAAPGIWLRMNSPAETRVDMSWRPAMTSVGLLIFGSNSR